MNWNGHTSQVDLNEASDHGFSSNIPKDYFEAGVEIQFHAKQFHFHTPSEHSYDGRLFDLEMHTVHLEEQDKPNGFMAAALGIMFDVNDYTA